MVYRAAIKMIFLAVTVFFTLAISSVCSMFEAIVLGTNGLEIMALKKISQNRGVILENLIADIDKTMSSILTANTIANTFGATLAGSQFAMLFSVEGIAAYSFPVLMTVSILFFSEILPKNIGIRYRTNLQKYIVYPLYWLCLVMSPIAMASSWVIGKIIPKGAPKRVGNDEIIMLADKGQKDGVISSQERDIIANSLSLADVTVSEIMTPRTVLYGLDQDMTVEQAFKSPGGLKFSRMPVYKDSIDNIVGIVRRREILTAVAADKMGISIAELSSPAMFVPENGSALAVLRQMIKRHQQMGIVVDEFASLTGVVTLEDIFEHILGSEIFDNDDIAVDMREFARTKRNKKD